MTIYQQAIAACWCVLLVLWFVLALVGGHRGRHSRRVWWLRLAVVAALLAAAYFLTPARPPPALAEPTRGVALAGVVLCVAGLSFALWARISMGRHWGKRLTQSDLTELVSVGPFAYVRHPIYAGTIAMLIGSGLNFPAAYVEMLLAILSLVVLARHDERDMLRLLPDVYLSYMQRTKRFVPFVF